MGFGGSHQSSSSGSWNRASQGSDSTSSSHSAYGNTAVSAQPYWAQWLGKSMASGFDSLFGNGAGLKSGLSNPLGVIGSQYRNLYEENPTNDFLGARQAIKEAISGDAFGKAYNQAYDTIMPSVRRSIEDISKLNAAQMSSRGLRFSSDLADLNYKAGRRYSDDATRLALEAARGQQALKLQGGLGVYGLVNNMANAQLQRQVPLAVALATGTPLASISQGWGGSSSYGRSHSWGQAAGESWGQGSGGGWNFRLW